MPFTAPLLGDRVGSSKRTREEEAMATATGAKTGTFNGELEELRTQLRGDAFTPTDPGFADVRAAFNAMHGGQPDVTISCSGTADVVDAVNFAREHGIQVGVRGGGHSIAGLS